ncbi:MAG: hypothetical protein ACR2NF_12685 [Pirellulales bacterium]
MPSENIDDLLDQVTNIEEMLQHLEAQAGEIKQARGSLSEAAVNLSDTADSLEGLIKQMRDASSTMKSLDMAATLDRIDKLEHRIDLHAQKQKDEIDKGLLDMADGLNGRVGELLTAMPDKVGSVIEETLSQLRKALLSKIEGTKSAIGEVVSITTSIHERQEVSGSQITEAIELNNNFQKKIYRWLVVIAILAGIAAFTPVITGVLRSSGSSIPVIRNLLPETN